MPHADRFAEPGRRVWSDSLMGGACDFPHRSGAGAVAGWRHLRDSSHPRPGAFSPLRGEAVIPYRARCRVWLSSPSAHLAKVWGPAPDRQDHGLRSEPQPDLRQPRARLRTPRSGLPTSAPAAVPTGGELGVVLLRVLLSCLVAATSAHARDARHHGPPLCGRPPGPLPQATRQRPPLHPSRFAPRGVADPVFTAYV